MGGASKEKVPELDAKQFEILKGRVRDLELVVLALRKELRKGVEEAKDEARSAADDAYDRMAREGEYNPEY